MTYPVGHVHGYVRIRFGWLRAHAPRVWAFLAMLRLPMVESGTLPHDPDCTLTSFVLRQEGDK